MTKQKTGCKLLGTISLRVKFHIDVLLFRVAEVHRTDETTATPFMEGAHLSELMIEQ